ncbi:MAG: hypothetical protein ACI9KE_003824, partial [Polyangiales bacterium]
SPEQAYGTSLDRRSDIYSLGIILWELLTQQRLFHAANDIALLELVRHPKIPLPSSLAPEVSPALDAIVMKALAQDPGDRPATTSVLRAELAAAVPEALGVTQDEVAELLGLITESHVSGENSSVHSANDASKQASVTARSAPVPGPPSTPPMWGELDEDGELTSFLLAEEDLLQESSPSQLKAAPVSATVPVDEVDEPTTRMVEGTDAEPKAPTAPPRSASNKLPIEFDMVEAADIEVDLPQARTGAAASGSLSPRQAMSPGPSVLVEGKFFERLPFAFVAPLLGKAWALLLFSALVPACASLLLTLDVGLVLRVSFAVPALLFSIGLLTEVFSRLAQEGADNDEGVPSPTLGDTDLQTVLGSGITTVFIVALLFVLPAYLFLSQYIGIGTFTALSFLPYVYWPMALTVQGITGDVVAGLNLPLVFRSMARVPLKYLVVVALGFGLTVALSLGSAFVVGALMVVVGPSRALIFGATFVFFGTMTYLHGVVGYAMGRLVATSDRLANSL